jgi:hypothetical protein
MTMVYIIVTVVWNYAWSESERDGPLSGGLASTSKTHILEGEQSVRETISGPSWIAGDLFNRG